ncbi:MAG: EamA family transporter [Patescibacteria group bacterium]
MGTVPFFGQGRHDSYHQQPRLCFYFFSGIAGAASWLFYFFALKHGPASSVASIDRLSVVFVLVLAVLFLGEHLTWKSGIGAALVAAGAVLMSLK